MGITNTGTVQHNFLGVSQVAEAGCVFCFFFLFHDMTCDLIDYLEIFFLILYYFELLKYCYLRS